MNLELYLTTRCQMECAFCGAWYRATEAPSLPLDKACEIIAAAARKGYRYLALSGGEPFLHPHLPEIVQYAIARGFYVSVFTNGLLLDYKHLDAFGATPVNIRVSLHTLQREQHKTITGADTLPRVLAGIQRLQERQMYFSLTATMYDINLPEIASLADFAVESGAAAIRFTPVFGLFHGDAIQLDEGFYVRMLREVVAATIRHKQDLDYRRQPTPFAIDYMRIHTTRRCSAGTHMYTGVDAALHVLPCPVVPRDDRLPHADYTSMEGVQAYNAAFQQVFDDAYVEQLEGRCATCLYKRVCRGGCLATKLTTGRPPTAEQPICMLAVYDQVMAAFPPSETADLAAYWQHRYEKMSTGADKDKGCLRQFPMWQLDFRRKRSDMAAAAYSAQDATKRSMMG